jgi:hypothetical protein
MKNIRQIKKNLIYSLKNTDKLNMKLRKFVLQTVFFVMTCAFAFSAKNEVIEKDTYDYDVMVSKIDSMGAPYVEGNYAIFTASKDARFVGIAFDFENYRTIHSFKLRTVRDKEYKVTDSFYFYILELPKNVQALDYRLIVDGLWITDPLNESTVYNEQTGIKLSHLDTKRYIAPVTDFADNGNVHFVYRGLKGEKVRLGGSFTNWDSWIYEMPEVSPGLYVLDLPLPPGKYEYNFFTGLTAIVDSGNPQRVYTADGREASLLIVN